MKESMLPVEFSGLAGKVHYVVQVTHNEWSSSCPQCGGVPHKSGEFPDRFRMWTKANGKNKIMGWCRHCSFVWFPNSDTNPITPQEAEKWRLERIEHEERVKAEAEQALANLRSERIWEKYHLAVNEWVSGIIDREWGISKSWSDYWKLGMVADFVVKNKEESYHSPGITIPLWQPDGNIANVKVRVLNPKNPGDRYRSLYKMHKPFLFTAFPNENYKTCLVTEGEKKAMCCAQWLQEKMQVKGIPTKTPNINTLKELDSFENIIVCLDPDAAVEPKEGVSPLRRLVAALGKERVRVLQLPFKVDDMIVKGGLDITDALRYTKKMEV